MRQRKTPSSFWDAPCNWIRGKRSAPDEWMQEEDLLAEDELREKLKRDQDQKRKFQECHHEGYQILGTQQSPREGDRSRFDFRNSRVPNRVVLLSSRGDKTKLVERIRVEKGGSIEGISIEVMPGVVSGQEEDFFMLIRIYLCPNGRSHWVQVKGMSKEKVRMILVLILGC